MQRSDKLDFAKRSGIAILSFSLSGVADFLATRPDITRGWYAPCRIAVVLFAMIGLALIVWAISGILFAAKGRNGRTVTIIVVIALVGLLLLDPFSRLLLAYPFKSIGEHIRRIPFDSVAWQDMRQVESHDPVRLRMVDDLVDSHRLDHLSRSEVQILLGKHTERETTVENFKDYETVYWLGPLRAPISIDDEWLAISYDEEGHVKSYAVVSD